MYLGSFEKLGVPSKCMSLATLFPERQETSFLGRYMQCYGVICGEFRSSCTSTARTGPVPAGRFFNKNSNTLHSRAESLSAASCYGLWIPLRCRVDAGLFDVRSASLRKGARRHGCYVQHALSGTFPHRAHTHTHALLANSWWQALEPKPGFGKWLAIKIIGSLRCAPTLSR
ncbi:hypothetical protein N656DRAFT_277143 [Canariomyces notabilis]|uniref:Uncharacterized protein n=1 Tax=Canariomyces notabilis TaxID=2074819 RepID=A0AAN6YWY7_9PEZI|nr:hypothetical protein N656DRAFT_277143 [Canariomyces arenarius]